MKSGGFGSLGESQAVVVTHGGAGNDWAHVDGCEVACQRAWSVLQKGGTARAAAAEAVMTLEDDPRFNAGRGATLRLDGKTIQLDAAIMDEQGFGAVAAVERIHNPILLAEAVYNSPHLMLVADGAEALAEKLKLPRGNLETETSRNRFDQRRRELASEPFWAEHDMSSIWQFALDSGTACDTVGAVVRDAQGNWAAAGSTGGLWCALRGRVGDTPILGAGLYVGEAGAVAATGVGEYIWKKMLSLKAYERMRAGDSPRQALNLVLREDPHRPGHVDIGLIAIGKTGYAACATRDMPWAHLGEEEKENEDSY